MMPFSQKQMEGLAMSTTSEWLNNKYLANYLSTYLYGKSSDIVTYQDTVAANISGDALPELTALLRDVEAKIITPLLDNGQTFLDFNFSRLLQEYNLPAERGSFDDTNWRTLFDEMHNNSVFFKSRGLSATRTDFSGQASLYLNHVDADGYNIERCHPGVFNLECIQDENAGASKGNEVIRITPENEGDNFLDQWTSSRIGAFVDVVVAQASDSEFIANPLFNGINSGADTTDTTDGSYLTDTVITTGDMENSQWELSATDHFKITQNTSYVPLSNNEYLGYGLMYSNYNTTLVPFTDTVTQEYQADFLTNAPYLQILDFYVEQCTAGTLDITLYHGTQSTSTQIDNSSTSQWLRLENQYNDSASWYKNFSPGQPTDLEYKFMLEASANYDGTCIFGRAVTFSFDEVGHLNILAVRGRTDMNYQETAAYEIAYGTTAGFRQEVSAVLQDKYFPHTTTSASYLSETF